MANEIPAIRRAQVRLRDQYRCVRCGCPTDPGHWHHRRSRSVRDEWTHSSANGVLLCKTCHDWVHDHPFLARRVGLIVSRHVANPSEQPVLCARRGWVLLDDEGQFQSTEGIDE